MEILIPKDIRSYKTKLIGNFSARECIGLVLLAIGAYAMYVLMHFISPAFTINNPVTGLLCFLGAAPGILYGFAHPYGMKAEAFLRTVFLENFLSPKVRPFATPRLFEEEKTMQSKTAPKKVPEELKGYR